MDKLLKNEMRLIELHMELRQLAEEFYVVYKAFVDAAFTEQELEEVIAYCKYDVDNEKQALALTVNLMREEEE